MPCSPPVVAGAPGFLSSSLLLVHSGLVPLPNCRSILGMSSVKKITWQSTWQPPLAVLVLQRCGSRRMETPPQVDFCGWGARKWH